MRKLIFQMMVSLDGYFEGPGRDISWHTVDAEFNDYAMELLSSVDLLLFGRVTYELMSSYWPSAEAMEHDPVVADKMNELPKIVFSTTMNTASWNNTILVKDNLVEEVTRLKQQKGKNIAIFGSSNLALSFIENNLIDEFRMIISPVVLGSGNTLFKGLQHRLNMKLERTDTFISGNVLLYYKMQESNK